MIDCFSCKYVDSSVTSEPCCRCEDGCTQWASPDKLGDAPQPSKTLLDEFAMSAMESGLFLDNPYAEGALVEWSYLIAAAMMKERARRDEMGNVKEVK